MEDILNTQQRPKVEIFDEYIFIVMKIITLNVENELKIEHLSILLGENFVITFQESEGDIFDLVRDRIKNSKGRIRKFIVLAIERKRAIIPNPPSGTKILLDDKLICFGKLENIRKELHIISG